MRLEGRLDDKALRQVESALPRAGAAARGVRFSRAGVSVLVGKASPGRPVDRGVLAAIAASVGARVRE